MGQGSVVQAAWLLPCLICTIASATAALSSSVALAWTLTTVAVDLNVIASPPNAASQGNATPPFSIVRRAKALIAGCRSAFHSRQNRRQWPWMVEELTWVQVPPVLVDLSQESITAAIHRGIAAVAAVVVGFPHEQHHGGCCLFISSRRGAALVKPSSSSTLLPAMNHCLAAIYHQLSLPAINHCLTAVYLPPPSDSGGWARVATRWLLAPKSESGP
jgi:hypothetical protein